jgi:citrate lyase subunit beta/citryl-CoA lyase
MDGPYANFKDEAGFENACRVALAMGFDGKQCIHPTQLATVNRIFAPSPDELNWAVTVVTAYEQATTEGRGAISVNGKMIDAANVRMAQTILQRQQAIEAKQSTA